MFVVLLICFIVALVIFNDYVRKSGYRWKKLCEFPGDAPLPVLGNGLQLGFDADEASLKLMAIWERHGKQNFRMTVGSEDWVLLSDPDDVGSILNSTTELTKQLERNVAMKPFFGNSVSSSEGGKWRSVRKLMTPSFHFKTLEKRVEDVNKNCPLLFDILDTYEDKGPVDLYRYLRPYMFDIICSTLMGVETNYLQNPDDPYIKASGKVINIINQNYFSYWRNIRFLFVLTPIYWDMISTIKTIRQTSADLIVKRREKINKVIEDIKNNNKNVEINFGDLIKKKLSDGGCLLDRLILSISPDGKPTKDDMINEEITLVCFTGHYTTTMTISHTLYCLAKYPDVQRKVLEEQEHIFKNNFHRESTNQDLNQMKYLEAVIKESIRVVPTVTKIGRQLHEDMTFKDGRVAPAGTSVIIFYDAMYQNPKLFPEPEKYKPERFLESMHPFAFVPFSAGPRNCIGFRYAWVAMKATLSNILRRYEVLPGGPGTEPEFAYRIITESKNGLRVRLKKRNI